MAVHVTVLSHLLNANIIFNKQDLNSISVDWVRDAQIYAWGSLYDIKQNITTQQQLTSKTSTQTASNEM